MLYQNLIQSFVYIYLLLLLYIIILLYKQETILSFKEINLYLAEEPKSSFIDRVASSLCLTSELIFLVYHALFILSIGNIVS